MTRYIASHWFFRLFFRNLVAYEEKAIQLSQLILTDVKKLHQGKEASFTLSDDLLGILEKAHNGLTQTLSQPTHPEQSSITASDIQEAAAIQLTQEIAQRLSQLNENAEVIITGNLPSMLQQVRDQLIHISKQPQSTKELQPAVKSLIKLRDWSLLAQDNLESDPKFLTESLYRKLGDILHDEGVISLEDNGRFNFETQRVVDTRSTEDEALIDTIYATVRPGYIYQGKRIRSQDVIIYTHS